MANVLPVLGRKGYQTKVRKLWGLDTPGTRLVDPNAEFVSGMLGTLSIIDGAPRVTNVTAVGDVVVGMFFGDKAVSYYKNVFQEVLTVSATDEALNLKNAYVKTGTVKVTTVADPATPVTSAGNWTLTSADNGTITITGGGALDGEAEVLVSYMAKDMQVGGIDQTMGSGKITMLEGKGELATQVYDTSVAWALNDSVYFTDEGILTTIDTGSAIVGVVTAPPASGNPELRVKVDL